MYAFLADVVTTVHLAVVTFMIAGLLVVLIGWPLRWQWIRNPWFRVSHLVIMAYIAINAMRGELCFLTHLEMWLRRRAGQSLAEPDEWSFVGRLLHDILFVETPQATLDKIYLGFGAVVLLTIVGAPPRLRRRASTA